MGSDGKKIIELENISKLFPGVKALDQVQLTIREGEVHALMGENGAGKSTLIKVIAGVYKPDGGSYRIDGREAAIQNPHDARQAGISVVYQELNMVSDLTVAENIFFGNYPRKKKHLVDWKALNEAARQILDEMEADIDPSAKVGYLPVGKQQLVEIAKALATHPRVLIMDEPTSALSVKEIEHLYSVIRKLKKKGVAVIYVSHKLDEIYAITDRITVMRDGQYIGCSNTADLPENELIKMMVGHEVGDAAKRDSYCSGNTQEKLLEVQDFSTDRVKNISFSIGKGEIVGFAGLMGAGRTELAKGIVGVDRRIHGSVRIEGKELPKNSPASAKKAGIGFVPEDRKQSGIIAGQSVGFNISVSALGQVSHHASISKKKEAQEIQAQIESLAIKTASDKVKIETLSGGNQQKAILSRWLMKKDLKLLIIDEPTRGIDIGAKAEIYSILDRLARQGVSIMLISSEMPEITGLCDRVYVMNNGRIRGELKHDEMEITQEKVLTLAI